MVLVMIAVLLAEWQSCSNAANVFHTIVTGGENVVHLSPKLSDASVSSGKFGTAMF